MSDEQPIRWEWRYASGMLALGFNASIISWIVFFGASGNLLHQQALSWCFTLSALVLAGLGIGATMPDIGNLVGRVTGK